MDLLKIIAELKKYNVVPVAEGDTIRLTGNTDGIPATFITTLTVHKDPLLEYLHSAQHQMDTDDIPVADMKPLYPCTAAQKRMWYISQLDNAAGLYNIVVPVRIGGHVDEKKLQAAFHLLMQRHAILRTVFSVVEGRLFQQVNTSQEFTMNVSDLYDVEDKSGWLRSRLAELQQQSFQLDKGQLFRAQLVRLSPEESVLILVIHHIITDGWSVRIMMQEIVENYANLPLNRPLPEIQYADYAEWMERRLAGERGRKAVRFWQQRFPEAPPVLALPYDFRRPPILTFDGSFVRMDISPATHAAILDFCRRQNTTLFHFLHMALSILLSGYSGQSEILVGVPVSGRIHSQLHNQLGLFVNTIPLRSDIDRQETCIGLLRRLTAESVDAFEFQDFPFDEIIRNIPVTRDPSRNPLFDVMLVVQSPAPPLALSDEQLSFSLGLPDEPVSGPAGHQDMPRPAKTDLAFVFDYRPDGRLFLEIEYAVGLFSPQTIRRMYESLDHIIRQVLREPGSFVGDIALVDEREERLLLQEFNTPVGERKESSILTILGSSLEEYAEKTAIVSPEYNLTYREIAGFAAGIGRLLTQERSEVRRTTIEPAMTDTPVVGLLVGRSPMVIPMIIGIWSAGAAYVPIDPVYPSHRIDYIIEDARPDILIVDALYADLVPAGFKGKVLFTDAAVFPTEAADPAPLVIPPDVAQDRLAYIIYTSGSTGKPKGVCISHGNAIAFLCWAQREFAGTPFRLCYAVTSYCFDLSLYELFVPLLLGRTIRMLGSALDIPSYTAQDEGVLLNTVPSVVNRLAADIDWQHVTALNLAGEALTPAVIGGLDPAVIEIRNLYGPTEDTTYSTVYRLTGMPPATQTGIPIGKPVDHTQLYILDENRRLVPVGVEGEIYLSGLSTSPGYLHRPDLTEKSFVDNPFFPGLRMYKTGDIGKWLSDGNAVFLRRTDNQVKIRGHRVEPEEIRHSLEEHPLVEQAVITALVANDEQRLAVYWTGGGTPAGLKVFLQRRLPSWMIPDYWIPLTVFPLTVNGKLDRNNLPDPLTGEVIPSIPDGAMPLSPWQEKLTDIWKEILGRTTIGIDELFLGAGGSSLLLARLKYLVEYRLHRQVSVNELFSNPTIRAQAALLEQRPRVVAGRILRTADSERYPVSFTQERLWLLTRYEEASVAYNMPVAFLLEAAPDIALLQQCLQALVQRHEILRTVFPSGDLPAQQVLASGQLDFTIRIHTFDIPADESEEAGLLQRLSRIPFQPDKGPLLAAALLLNGDRSILFFNMHHLIGDGWSAGILYRELLADYFGRLQGRHLPSPVLTLQYRDYAHWQRERVAGGYFQGDLDYWQAVLKDAPVLSLPTDHNRPLVKTYKGGKFILPIGLRYREHLAQLQQTGGASLFMVFTALVNALLKKYSGQDDIVVGVPVAGRDHQQLEGQIGFYANTLALRTKIEPSASFAAFLQQQKMVVLEALDHQDCPFGLVLQQLSLQRDLSRSPLFDVMALYEETTIGMEPDGAPVAFRRIPVEPQTAKYDLTFGLFLSGDDLQLELEYNTDLFYETSVARMARHFLMVLEQAAINPDIVLRDISLIDDEEGRVLRAKTDRSQIPYDESATIVSLFSNAVSGSPEKTAVRFGEKTLTYAQLDRLSSDVANSLRSKHGVRTGDRVLLWFQRSEWMVAAIFGVLKAGAVYVPVDPDYPARRTDYIIGDTRSQWILADGPPDQRICGQWPSLQWIDAGEWSVPDAETPATPEGKESLPVIAPTDLAYIIYTSGTTGTPKGVMIEHRNVVRLLFNAEMPYDFCSSDKWVLFHSYCFDVSVWEIFGCLLYGGTLLVISKETIRDSRSFYDFLLKEGVTVLNQTPTAFRSLTLNNESRFATAPATAVRYLIFAGEALMPEVLKAWRRHMPRCRNINMYGITETTVHVTFKEITNHEIENNTSNIGVPLPTLSLYVLDKDLRSLPAGIPGELFVGGAGVGRGYWNKPELSAERFLADPFYPGGKLYRSGDYARLLDSGDIEYIGRRDDQVKIRGHRIELNEVTAAFGKIPGVKDVIVLSVKNAAGDSELAAYYVSDGADALSLRRQLQQALPLYMIPSYLISLAAFPMNANGKLDRDALPGHLSEGGLSDRSGEDKKAAAPRQAEDRWLIALWERILERENVGIRDNFFYLGGHSIKATRVLAAIADRYEVKIDMGTFFAEPTIESLSDQLRMRLLQGDLAVQEGIRPLQSQSDYVLSSAQRRLWLLSRNEEASRAYHVYGSFIFSGAVNVRNLDAAFRRLLERHEILRTVFRINAAGEIRQVIVAAEKTGFNLDEDHPEDDPDSVSTINRRLEDLRSRPFDLATGPLIRAAIYRLGPEEWVFGCCMHHIISDGWSIHLFTRELLTLYRDPEGLSAPLPIQYKDYAAWQQEQLVLDTHDVHRAYWQERYSGEIPVLRLPGDKTRPALKTYHGDGLRLELETARAAALAGLCRECGCTPFMGLLAAVDLLLHRYTGQDDIIVGSPVAGRQQAGLDNQLGFYVNTLALRNRCAAEANFRQLLQEVRRTTLEAYEHQEHPFDELVAGLPQRDPSRNPLFDVWVVVHQDPGSMPDPGFKITEHAPAGDYTGRYDLMFAFTVLGDNIRLEIQYNTDIFISDTIDRMAGHFQRLLAHALLDPDKPIGRLEMLTVADRHELLACGTAARSAEMKAKIVIGLFESQVAATPGAMAVRAEDGRLTYAELNSGANRLAHYLRHRHGVHPGDLVGIRMPRSKYLITGILGILKSGAAYVPIDPDYPADRIAFMMEDSGCLLLVDETLLAEALQCKEYSMEDPSPVNGSDDLVYVIYTSGSTGKPKGVMIDNRALLDYHYSILDVTNLRECRSFGHFSTIAADLGNTMLYTSLLIGGELVLFPPSGIIPGDKDLMVDAMKIVPSHWKALQTDERKVLPRKCLLFGGERLTSDIADVVLAAGPDLHLYNHYGPTETTIGKLLNRVEESGGLRDVPLGQPFGNTRCYVLDEEGRLTPKGMIGEIVIGGDGLARGYLGRPQLTAQRFVPDPFLPGQWVYKTGDLGRWTTDHKLVFLGRKDAQIKINGYRVEPGEIEQVLVQQPGIDAALVVARENREKILQLTGYISGSGLLDISSVRRTLAAQLPAYMIPAQLIVLENFPLTRNGKIDRDALPSPEESVVGDRPEYIPPGSDIEKTLARIFSDVLSEGKEPVGINDNFFHSGGHSLKAIKVMLRVHEQFQVELDLNYFYNEPTVAALATEIDNILWLRASSGDRNEINQPATI